MSRKACGVVIAAASLGKRFVSSAPLSTLIVGGSGSGKSASYVIPTIRNSGNASLVVHDPKGELYQATAQERRRFGPVFFVDWHKKPYSWPGKGLARGQQEASKRLRQQTDNKSQDMLYSISSTVKTKVRLDVFLFKMSEHTTHGCVSRNRIQEVIHSGLCFVNGTQATKGSYDVKYGDSISYTMHQTPTKDYILQPKDIPLDIIYEDDFLVAINKAPFIAVHPSDTTKPEEDTIVNGLANLYPIESFGDTKRPFLIHRLDKDTSGVLLAAKTKSTMTTMAGMHSEMYKEYIVIVHGMLSPRTGTIEHPIERDPNNRLKMHVGGTRAAKTEYVTIATNKYFSILRCVLHTGRTHQIRVHLNYIGHPIIHDTKYSNLPSKHISRQAIHSHIMRFTHPVTNEATKIIAPIRQDMIQLAHACELNVDRIEEST